MSCPLARTVRRATRVNCLVAFVHRRREKEREFAADVIPMFLPTDGEVEQEGDVDGHGQCRGDGEQGHEDGGVLRVHRVGAEQGRAQPGGMAWLPCSGRGAVAAAPDGARSCC